MHRLRRFAYAAILILLAGCSGYRTTFTARYPSRPDLPEIAVSVEEVRR